MSTMCVGINVRSIYAW